MSEPRLPTIGDWVRGTGRLVDVQLAVPPAPPPTPPTDFIFEYVSARVETLGSTGTRIARHTSYNDFYGEGTAVETAIREAKRLFALYGPGVIMAVVKITERCRFRAVPGKNYHAEHLSAFAPLEPPHHNRDLPGPIEETVWTSKETES